MWRLGLIALLVATVTGIGDEIDFVEVNIDGQNMKFSVSNKADIVLTNPQDVQVEAFYDITTKEDCYLKTAEMWKDGYNVANLVPYGDSQYCLCVRCNPFDACAWGISQGGLAAKLELQSEDQGDNDTSAESSEEDTSGEDYGSNSTSSSEEDYNETTTAAQQTTASSDLYTGAATTTQEPTYTYTNEDEQAAEELEEMQKEYEEEMEEEEEEEYKEEMEQQYEDLEEFLENEHEQASEGTAESTAQYEYVTQPPDSFSLDNLPAYNEGGYPQTDQNAYGQTPEDSQADNEGFGYGQENEQFGSPQDFGYGQENPQNDGNPFGEDNLPGNTDVDNEQFGSPSDFGYGQENPQNDGNPFGEDNFEGTEDVDEGFGTGTGSDFGYGQDNSQNDGNRFGGDNFEGTEDVDEGPFGMAPSEPEEASTTPDSYNQPTGEQYDQDQEEGNDYIFDEDEDEDDDDYYTNGDDNNDNDDDDYGYFQKPKPGFSGSASSSTQEETSLWTDGMNGFSSTQLMIGVVITGTIVLILIIAFVVTRYRSQKERAMYRPLMENFSSTMQYHDES